MANYTSLQSRRSKKRAASGVKYRRKTMTVKIMEKWLGPAVIVFMVTLMFLTDSVISYQGEGGYVSIWCGENGGEEEYRLPDRTRVDCLTDEYAIEFDYAAKWKESIGQALHYARLTGRKPAIMIIAKNPGEADYYIEPLLKAIDYGVRDELDLKVMIMTVHLGKGSESRPRIDSVETIRGQE